MNAHTNTLIALMGLSAMTLSGCSSLGHECCEPPIESTDPNSNSSHFSQTPTACVLNAHGTNDSGTLLWPHEVWFIRPTSADGYHKHFGILLLHQLEGVTPQCLHLANLLANELKCNVFVPVLFGKQEQSQTSDGLCQELFNDDWSGSFLSEHHTPKIVSKLRLLKTDISSKYAIKNWGVIGMCMTGSYSIAFMHDPDVKFAVCAQPATPLVFGWLPNCITPEGHRALGLSYSDLQDAKQSSTPVFYLRFDADKISPIERESTLQNLFEDRLDADSICEYGPHITYDAHDTLTYPRDLSKPSNPVNRHVEKLLSKLKPLIH